MNRQALLPFVAVLAIGAAQRNPISVGLCCLSVLTPWPWSLFWTGFYAVKSSQNVVEALQRLRSGA